MKTEGLIDFIIIDWQQLLIALIAGGFFLLIGNYIQKNYFKKLKVAADSAMGFKQAKNKFLDILEDRVVNEQDITPSKIENLIAAIGREHSTRIHDYPPISILQDLQLRFETSRQLAPEQKNKHCEKIEDLIKELKIKESEAEVPIGYKDVVNELKEYIETGDKKDALDTLELLKKKIKEKEESLLLYSYDRKSYYLYFLRLIVLLSFLLYFLWFLLRFPEILL